MLYVINRGSDLPQGYSLHSATPLVRLCVFLIEVALDKGLPVRETTMVSTSCLSYIYLLSWNNHSHYSLQNLFQITFILLQARSSACHRSNHFCQKVLTEHIFLTRNVCIDNSTQQKRKKQEVFGGLF